MMGASATYILLQGLDAFIAQTKRIERIEVWMAVSQWCWGRIFRTW